jgi:dsDNA-specific endonuclease/ATPase MutS2
MNKITDKATYHILELKKIISSIKPLSEPGKKLKAGLTPFKQSDIEIAKAEYIEIGKIVEYCQNSKSDIEGLKLWLSHIKDLSGSVEVCRDNTLELHEMQELKTLALAVSKISEILAGTDIELSTLNTMKDFYTYLDPQNTETSSFQIYDEFSPELEELRLKLADLSRKKKLAQNAKLNLAKQSLNLTKCEPEIIISRSNKALIGQVNESGIFYLSNENFANLFYSLKEDDKDRQIAEEIANTLTEMKVIEKAVRCQISEHIRSNYLTDIVNSTRAIAQFDLRLSKALFAIKNDCVIPHLTTTKRIVISQAVNLPMKKDFAGIEMVYQAVDIDLDNP